MPQVQYQGLSIERDGEGRTTAYTYHGSRSAMETLAAGHTVGETGSAGRLKSLKLRHKQDTIWECELVYELSADGSSVTAPDTDWGHKSCRLHGGIRKFSICTITSRHEGKLYSDFGDIRREYCLAARRAADAMNTCLVPLDAVFDELREKNYAKLSPEGLLYTRDGLHLNAEGNRIAADAMLRAWHMI